MTTSCNEIHTAHRLAREEANNGLDGNTGSRLVKTFGWLTAAAVAILPLAIVI